MKGSCRYPTLQKVVAGKMKEQDKADFILTLHHPKLGGSTTISLSVFTNYTNRLGMSRDLDAAQEIKRGLTDIVSTKESQTTLHGLIADHIFKTLNWTIRPVE